MSMMRHTEKKPHMHNSKLIPEMIRFAEFATIKYWHNFKNLCMQNSLVALRYIQNIKL